MEVPDENPEIITMPIINITYTIFNKKEEQSLEDLEKNAIKFKNKILEEYEKKEYKVQQLTIGIHKNASRPHIHLGHVLYVGLKQLAHWDKHLRGLINLDKNTFNDKIDIKISYKDKVGAVDIQNVLAYPLKEYETETEIKYIEQFIGLTQKEIYNLRDYANQIYKRKLYENKKSEDKKIIEEENTDSKYKYLDTELQIDNHLTKIRFKENPITLKLKQVLIKLLNYEKLQHIEKNKRVFRSNCMLDLAISYLYFRELANEEEIIEYKFRL